MTKRLSDSKVSSMVISDYFPDGATVTPVDDYTIWLECAGLPNTYGSLANVIADTTAMETLCNNLNALRYMVRSEDVIMPAVLDDADWVAELDGSAYAVTVPTMTSDTTPSGVASASSKYNTTGTYDAYKVFDSSSATYWASSGFGFPSWVQYQFTKDIYVYKFQITNPSAVDGGYLFNLKGSTDGTNFDTLTEDLTKDTSTSAEAFVAESFGEYDYYRIDLHTKSAATYCEMQQLQFYGLDLS